jgi:hypothetical protein
VSLVLNVEILGEFRKLTAATQGAEGTLKGLQDKVGRFAGNIGRIAGTLGVTFGFAALIRGAKDSVEAASDLEQQYGALDSIFKGNSDEMKVFSESMGEIGLSSADAARNSAYLGSMLKGAGLGLDDTTEKTQDLVKLAGDLAATYGGSTADAVGAIASLMRGERDPIERYGVSLKQVDINAQKLTDAKNGLVFESEKEADMQAALTLLYDKTGDAQGQAARESETYAGVTGRLDAAFQNLQAQVGEALLPTLSDLAAFFEDVIPKISAFFDELYDPSTELGGAWEDLGEVFKIAMDAFNDMLKVFGGSGISFKSVLDFVILLTAGFGQLFFFVGRVADIIGSIISLNFQKALDLTTSFAADYGSFVTSQNLAMRPPEVPNIRQIENAQNVTINVNNGNVTAQQIADTLNRASRSSGTNLIRGIS